MKLVISVLLASFQLLAQAGGKEHPMKYSTLYRTVQIDGLSISYREAGPKDAPALLLLHGLPSSSRMFEPLFARLSDRYPPCRTRLPGRAISGMMADIIWQNNSPARRAFCSLCTDFGFGRWRF